MDDAAVFRFILEDGGGQASPSAADSPRPTPPASGATAGSQAKPDRPVRPGQISDPAQGRPGKRPGQPDQVGNQIDRLLKDLFTGFEQLPVFGQFIRAAHAMVGPLLRNAAVSDLLQESIYGLVRQRTLGDQPEEPSRPAPAPPAGQETPAQPPAAPARPPDKPVTPGQIPGPAPPVTAPPRPLDDLEQKYRALPPDLQKSFGKSLGIKGDPDKWFREQREKQPQAAQPVAPAAPMRAGQIDRPGPSAPVRVELVDEPTTPVPVPRLDPERPAGAPAPGQPPTAPVATPEAPAARATLEKPPRQASYPIAPGQIGRQPPLTTAVPTIAADGPPVIQAPAVTVNVDAPKVPVVQPTSPGQIQPPSAVSRGKEGEKRAVHASLFDAAKMPGARPQLASFGGQMGMRAIDDPTHGEERKALPNWGPQQSRAMPGSLIGDTVRRARGALPGLIQGAASKLSLGLSSIPDVDGSIGQLGNKITNIYHSTVQGARRFVGNKVQRLGQGMQRARAAIVRVARRKLRRLPAPVSRAVPGKMGALGAAVTVGRAAAPIVAGGATTSGATAGAAGAAAAGGAPLAAGAMGLVSVLGPVGIAAGAVTAAMGALAMTTRALDQQFRQRADEIAPFSPDLIVSRAQNQIAKMRQDMQAAKTIGPGLAQYEDSKASIGRSMQRLEDAVTKGILDNSNEALRFIATIAEAVSRLAPAIEKGAGMMTQEGLTRLLSPFLGEGMARAVVGAFANTPLGKNLNDWLSEQLGNDMKKDANDILGIFFGGNPLGVNVNPPPINFGGQVFQPGGGVVNAAPVFPAGGRGNFTPTPTPGLGL